MRFLHSPLLLIVIFVCFSSCVTDGDPPEEKATPPGDEVLVDVPAYDRNDAEPAASDAPLTIRPIDRQVIAKFPHLGNFSGTILVGNATTQFVLYGIPQQESVTGRRPLVLAAFSYSVEGWRKNHVFGGLYLEITTPEGNDIRIVGFDITRSEPEVKELTFVILPVAKNPKPIEIKASLRVDEGALHLAFVREAQDQGNITLSLSNNMGSWLKGKQHLSAYDGGDQVALVGQNYLAKPLDRHTWEVPLSSEPVQHFQLTEGSAALTKAMAVAEGCDGACLKKAGPYKIYLASSADKDAWLDRSVFLSSSSSWGAVHVLLSKDFPRILYFPDPKLRSSFTDPTAIADEMTTAVTAKPTYNILQAEALMKVDTIKGKGVDLKVESPPAFLALAAKNYPEGMKVFSVVTRNGVKSTHRRLIHSADSVVSFNTIAEHPEVFRFSKEGVLQPCFEQPMTAEKLQGAACESPGGPSKIKSRLAYGMQDLDPVKTLDGPYFEVFEANYGSRVRIWGNPDNNMEIPEDGVLKIGFEDIRGTIDLARRANPGVAVELMCPGLHMSVDDYVNLARMVEPDLLQVWGCGVGIRQEQLMAAYGHVVGALDREVYLSPSSEAIHLLNYGIQPGFVALDEQVFEAFSIQANSLLKQGTVAVGGGARLALSGLEVGSRRRIQSRTGGRLSQIQLNLRLRWQVAQGVTVRKIVLYFDQGSKVVLPVDGSKDGADLKAVRTVTKPDEQWLRAEVWGSTPYTQLVDPAMDEVPLAATRFYKLP